MTSFNFNNNEGQEIKATIRYAGKKPSSWGANVNQHNIVNIHNIATGEHTTFDFWGSKVHPNQDSYEGLARAMSAYTNDAIAYENSRNFVDFCEEFGYDIELTKDYKRAKSVYNACKKAKDKLEIVIGPEYHFISELEDKFTDEYINGQPLTNLNWHNIH